jgi:hypothetical protein
VRHLRVTALVSWLALTALGCGGDNKGTVAWTEQQAESVRVIRGQPVRVRACRGIGQARASEGFRSFECVAGTRIAGQPIDTVAVTYVLRPLAPYEEARPRYALSDVQFGGLGVP